MRFLFVISALFLLFASFQVENEGIRQNAEEIKSSLINVTDCLTSIEEVDSIHFEDTITINSSNLLIGQISDSTLLSRYQHFAKLYGYARYFHPLESNKTINWDAFIYNGFQEIEKEDHVDEIIKLKNIFSEITSGLELSNRPISISTISNHEKEFKYWQHYGYGFGDISWYSSKIIGVNDSTKRMNGIGFSNTFNKMNDEPLYFQLTYKNDSDNVSSNPVKITFDFYNIENHKEQTFEYYPKHINDWTNDTFVVNPIGKELYLYTTINIQNAGELNIEKISISKKDSSLNKQNELFSIHFNTEDLSQIEDVQNNIHFAVKKEMKFNNGRHFLSFKSQSNEQLNKLFNNSFNEYTAYPFKLGNQIYGNIPLTLPLNATSEKSKLKNTTNTINPSNRYKALATVIITWNIIQHFSPHLDYIKTNWDDELLLSLSMADTCTSEKSIEFVIKTMMSKLNDGHAVIFSKNYSKKDCIETNTEIINEKLVITENQEDQLHKGDIVLEVNQKKMENVLSDLITILPGSIQRKLYLAKNEALCVTKGDLISLKILRAKDTINVENIKPISIKSDIQTKSITLLEEGIYLVDLFAITEPEFQEHLNLLKQAKGIVFDCRKGIRITHEILGYLIKDTIYYQPLYTPIILYPDRYKIAYDTSGKYPVRPKLPYLSCKSVFIIGPNIISSEEGFIGLVDYYNIGTTIGQPTAGCNGVYNRFYCLEELTVHFTGMEVKTQGNKQLYNIGIKPTYYVQTTLEEIQKGLDADLVKACQIINQN